jgi:hypothetical protein
MKKKKKRATEPTRVLEVRYVYTDSNTGKKTVERHRIPLNTARPQPLPPLPRCYRMTKKKQAEYEKQRRDFTEKWKAALPGLRHVSPFRIIRKRSIMREGDRETANLVRHWAQTLDLLEQGELSPSEIRQIKSEVARVLPDARREWKARAEEIGERDPLVLLVRVLENVRKLC